MVVPSLIAVDIKGKSLIKAILLKNKNPRKEVINMI